MAAAHNKYRKHSILKLGLKLTVMSLMLVGASMVFGGGGKVMADTACPANIGTPGFQEANDLNWGVPTGSNTIGSDGGNMAGLVIQAYDASDNDPVNLKYTLNSGVTGTGDDERHVAATPASPAYDYNYNARIFNATASSDGGTDFSGRHSGWPSGTDSILYNGNTTLWQCNGWDAFGPSSANTSMHGNGEVLDCGPLIPGPTGAVKQYTQFWFSNLSPNAYDDYDKNGNNIGQNGYWSVDITNGAGSNIHIDHWNPNAPQMGFDPSTVNSNNQSSYNNQGTSNLEFNVVNGSNTYVVFIWHPQTPPPPTGHDVDAKGSCTYVDVAETHTGNGDRTRVWAEVDGGIALGKQKYTDNAGNAHWTPDTNPSGNGSVHYGDPGQPAPPGSVASWVGPGTETGNPEDGDSGDLSISKEWWWQPQANTITVTYRVDNLPQTKDGKVYDYKNSSWNTGTTYYLDANSNWTTTPTSIDCFAACETNLTVDGDLPDNKVEADGPMHVSGTYTNTGLEPLWNPSVYASDGNYYPVQVGSENPLLPGDSAPFSFTMTAPDSVQYYGLSVSGQYYGDLDNGSSCSAPATVPIYQWFQASLTPSSTLKPNNEHPYQGDDYYANITVQQASSQSVYIPTSSSFYKLPAPGPASPYDSASNPDISPYPSVPTSPGATTTMLGLSNHAIADGTYAAGDEYCAYAHADYTTGYVGPDSTVVGADNPSDQYSCPRIVNEPYFKVNNSGIKAGGEFDQCLDNAHGGGGTLAGYNDDSDPPNVDRGSSSQLSALALIKITGVASAQTPGNISRSPTDLTFADTNPGDITPDSDSPGLGGNFGGCQTLTNETVPPSAAALSQSTVSANNPSGSMPAASGAYTYGSVASPANLTITGGTLPTKRNVSVFVNGNVYISGDIKYRQAADWTPGTVPSFVLHATGNIYIKPTVTSLAGLYIAEHQTDAHGNPVANTGRIYTCADGTGFAPETATNVYANCHNQLVIYGSFVADQVNLMRTLGSLRDEEPSGGVAPSAPACSNLGSQTITNTCAGEVFEFSPELYLSSGGTVCPAGGCGGPLQYQSLTSLPPVL